MNLKELKELIDLITEKGFTEFEIERQGFRMRISRLPNQQTVVNTLSPGASSNPSGPEVAQMQEREQLAVTQSAGAIPASAPAPEEQLHIIKSIMVGTFYRASSPSSEPFVHIGDHVEPDSVVCIIEAMKLMNPIQAELTGEVVHIYVENGQPVEYGQPLFGVRAA